MKMAKGFLIRNELVFWDKIMPRKNLKDFTYSKLKAKYPLVDIN